MSFQDSVSKLSSPVKELVQAVAQPETSLVGKTEKDQAEIAQWIDKVAQGDLVKAENIKVCNLCPLSFSITRMLFRISMLL